MVWIPAAATSLSSSLQQLSSLTSLNLELVTHCQRMSTLQKADTDIHSIYPCSESYDCTSILLTQHKVSNKIKYSITIQSTSLPNQYFPRNPQNSESCHSYPAQFSPKKAPKSKKKNWPLESHVSLNPAIPAPTAHVEQAPFQHKKTYH